MSRSLTGSLNDRRTVNTPLGQVAYLSSGSGPVALFIHGAFLNASLWEHQLRELADVRTCLAPDLLAHGRSAVPAPGTLNIDLQTEMIVAFLDALGLDQVDIVGSDSGGAIAQLVAVRAPQRVRSLTLTNCETHDNWPPAEFSAVHDLAAQGLLAHALQQIAAEPPAARSILASSFERPDDLPDAVIQEFFGPFADNARALALQDYINAMDSSVTVAIEGDLTHLLLPTLIVWGTADRYFDVKWAHWLENTIPGTVRCVEIDGAMLFHPAERPEVLNRELRDFWTNLTSHRVLNEYLDAWNRQDLEAVMRSHTEDTVFSRHIGGATYVGREDVLLAFKTDLLQWSDVRWEPIRRTVTGTACILESRLHAMAASKLEALGFIVESGAAVRGICVDWLTLEGERVARKDTYFDVIELLGSAHEPVSDE